MSSSAPRRAVAFAPASVGNVAVGFDLLGFCLGEVGDRITVERIESPEVLVRRTDLPLPQDPSANTATAGLVALRDDLGLRFGFAVSIEKGIALGSGMGGSAASAVGAIVAANALLPEPLSPSALLTYALIGEAVASGSYHPDNVAPCLLGGLTAARMVEDEPVVGGGKPRARAEAFAIPVPPGIWCALVRPHVRLETKVSRGLLRPDVTLRDHVRQSALLTGFIAGCFQNDLGLIKRSLSDVIVEPQRAGQIAGFSAAKAAALEAGALGCSIAGAGPSVFAWADGEERAHEVMRAMRSAITLAGSDCSAWTVRLPAPGARLIK